VPIGAGHGTFLKAKSSPDYPLLAERLASSAAMMRNSSRIASNTRTAIHD
jgi:hypothetical protein